MGVLARRVEMGACGLFSPGSRKGRTLEYAFKTIAPTLLTSCFWALFPFVSVLIKFGSSLSLYHFFFEYGVALGNPR